MVVARAIKTGWDTAAGGRARDRCPASLARVVRASCFVRRLQRACLFCYVLQGRWLQNTESRKEKQMYVCI